MCITHTDSDLTPQDPEAWLREDDGMAPFSRVVLSLDPTDGMEVLTEGVLCVLVWADVGIERQAHEVEPSAESIVSRHGQVAVPGNVLQLREVIIEGSLAVADILQRPLTLGEVPEKGVGDILDGLADEIAEVDLGLREASTDSRGLILLPLSPRHIRHVLDPSAAHSA